MTQAHSVHGIAESLRPDLVLPFSGGTAGDDGRDTRHDPIDATSACLGGRAGLRLAICRNTVVTLSGSLTLDHRLQHGRITGLDTTVRLPLADNPAP